MLSNTCDLPAKAMLLNKISHNGFYSCAKCLQPGKTTRSGKGSGHVHTFPYFLRSCRSTKNHQNSRKRSAKDALAEEAFVNGIRGPGSCIMSLPHFDICRGTGIDYMHCVLLNVVRQLLTLWFDPSFSSEMWSRSRQVGIVDYRLESIKPPSLITRVTRAVSKRKFWKASE